MVRTIEYRQLANILALFLIVQFAGLLIAFYLITPAVISVNTSGPSASSDVIFYFVYIMVGAVIMFLLFKTRYGVLIFRILEGLVILSASFYLFLIILASLLPQDSPYPMPVSLLLGVFLVAAKNKWPGLRNFAAVVSSVGVGLVLGIFFGFFAAYVLMALIAVYDYVAVFITKHMITLGREAVNRNLAFLIGSYEMEVVPKGYLKGKEEKEWSRALKGTKNKTIMRLVRAGNMPVPSFSALGAGDLAIPLMLAVSAYTTYFSFFTSLMIVLGASFGLVFSMYVSKKYMLALPAIPPLFSFVSIGFGLNLLISSPANWRAYALMFATSITILLLILFTAKRQSRKAGTRILPS